MKAGFLTSLDWSIWLYGLFAGGVGGGATAVWGALSASMVDSPFAVGSASSFKLMGMMFLMSFVKDAALYLKQNPMPAMKTVTTAVETTEALRQGKIVTTITESHTEPAEDQKVK
jgi:hypothetical protein